MLLHDCGSVWLAGVPDLPILAITNIPDTLTADIFIAVKLRHPDHAASAHAIVESVAQNFVL
jgi:hypothetical protein